MPRLKNQSDVLFSFSESSYFKMLLRGVVFPVVFQRVKSRVHAAPRPASSSLVSWPVTATVSHHLPIKATHFLPLSSAWFAVGPSDDGSEPSNWLFSCQQSPEWLTSSLGNASMWLLLFHLWWALRLTASLHLWSFIFFHCCCFFPTDPKTLNCFLVSFWSG